MTPPDRSGTSPEKASSAAAVKAAMWPSLARCTAAPGAHKGSRRCRSSRISPKAAS